MAWDDLTESERGYIAGFLDGEGSILLVRHNDNGKIRCRPVVAFYNTNLEVLDWIAGVIDVKINKRQADSRNDPRHRRTNYTIKINKYSEVYKFLLSIRPYLRIKKTNADIVIKFIEEVLERENRLATDTHVMIAEEYYAQLKKITSYIGGD